MKRQMEDLSAQQHKQHRKKMWTIAIVIVVLVLALAGVIVAVAFTTNFFKKPDEEREKDPVLPDEPVAAANFPAFKQMPKALYAWSHSKARVDNYPAWAQMILNKNYAFDRLVEFLLFNGFTEVTLFAGSVEWESSYFDAGSLPYESAFKEDLKKLHSKNIAVNLAFYINDEINNLTGHGKASQMASIVKRINDEGYPIRSIYFDQEPDDTTYYESLVEMLMASANIYQTGSSIKPLWLRYQISSISFESDDVLALIQGNSQISSFADLVNFIANDSQIMAYSNDWETVRSLSSTMEQSAAKFGLKTTAIVETGTAAADETLQQAIVANQDQFYQDFTAFAADYDRVVIHDYRQYYDNLHCAEPVVWKKLYQTRNCEAQVISDNVAPDITYDYNSTEEPGSGGNTSNSTGNVTYNENLEQNFQLYKYYPKALYVWAHGKEKIENQPAWAMLLQNMNYAFDRLVEFCLFHGITEISIFAGSVEWEASSFDSGHLPYEENIKEDLRKLHAKNIKANLAFYVNDEINNLTNWQYVPKIAYLVKNLNSTKYPINAIVLDQEPDSTAVYDSLAKMLIGANYAFPTKTSVKPLWLRQKLADIAFSDDVKTLISANKALSSFADLINFVTGGSEIMAYSNEYATVKSLANQMKQSAEKLNTSYTVIIETGTDAHIDPAETLTAVIKADQSQFYANVSALVKEYGHIAIHDYRYFYDNFMCSYPVVWKKLSSARDCSAESIPDTKAPDITYEYKDSNETEVPPTNGTGSNSTEPPPQPSAEELQFIAFEQKYLYLPTYEPQPYVFKQIFIDLGDISDVVFHAMNDENFDWQGYSDISAASNSSISFAVHTSDPDQVSDLILLASLVKSQRFNGVELLVFSSNFTFAQTQELLVQAYMAKKLAAVRVVLSEGDLLSKIQLYGIKAEFKSYAGQPLHEFITDFCPYFAIPVSKSWRDVVTKFAGDFTVISDKDSILFDGFE